MLVIQGKRTARIKRYTNNQQPCLSCKAFDLDVKVYRDYHHIFFIPVYPIGSKNVKIWCKCCGEPMRLEVVKKQYENISKTPFYLFALPILFVCLIAFAIYADYRDKKQNAIFVADPKVGDVYEIKKEENNLTTYYFLKLVSIKGDTVAAYHNNLEYGSSISKLNNEDFFVKGDEWYFTKAELKKMFDKTEINSVDRDYGDYEGFDRNK